MVALVTAAWFFNLFGKLLCVKGLMEYIVLRNRDYAYSVKNLQALGLFGSYQQFQALSVHNFHSAEKG